MFVICPKCASKYKIPSEIALKEGQKVQCSACQHVFRFVLEKETIKNESSDVALQVPENPVLPSNQVEIRQEEVIYSANLPEAFKPLKSEPTTISYRWLWTLICLLVIVIFILMTWMYRDMLNFNLNTTSWQTNRSLPRVSDPVKTKNIPNQTEEIPLFFEDELPEAKHVNLSDVFRFHFIRFSYEPSGLLIKGVIYNNTDTSHPLPPSIYATAYNAQGQILFQKEIILAKEIIQPYGQKDFFGTYSPAPSGVQWMEVSCEK